MTRVHKLFFVGLVAQWLCARLRLRVPLNLMTFSARNTSGCWFDSSLGRFSIFFNFFFFFDSEKIKMYFCFVVVQKIVGLSAQDAFATFSLLLFRCALDTQLGLDRFQEVLQLPIHIHQSNSTRKKEDNK